MTNYTKVVEALREAPDDWYDADLHRDAADAIEALQAEVERLKDVNDELREAQTYIDHYGDKWMTSAKDVPTAAYEHGYADGRDEAMAKMEAQNENISKFADGEWWKEAQK